MKRVSLAVLGVLASAAFVGVPSALADGGPYTGTYTALNTNGNYEQFRLSGGSCPSSSYNVQHRWQSGGHFNPNDPYSGWASLGGCVFSFDVGRNKSGTLEVFGLGTNDAVWHIYQANPGSGPWDGWYSLGGDFYYGPWVGSEIANNQPNLHVYGLYNVSNARGVDYQTSPGCCWSGFHPG